MIERTQRLFYSHQQADLWNLGLPPDLERRVPLDTHWFQRPLMVLTYGPVARIHGVSLRVQFRVASFHLLRLDRFEDRDALPGDSFELLPQSVPVVGHELRLSPRAANLDVEALL